MIRKPIVNVPKEKKAPKPLKRTPLSRTRKPIQKVGKRGKLKIANKRSSLDLYFELHGWQATERMEALARCQMCGQPMWRSQADACHKIRASQGGSERPENLVAAHRACHAWQHQSRPPETALLASDVTILTGGVIDWPDGLGEALKANLQN